MPGARFTNAAANIDVNSHPSMFGVKRSASTTLKEAEFTDTGALYVNIEGGSASTTTTPTRASTADTPTNRSGTIAAGDTAETVAAANTSRKYFLFQNVSDIDMWISLVGTAVKDSPSIRIIPGAMFTMEGSSVLSSAVSVICVTTGKKWTAWEA